MSEPIRGEDSINGTTLWRVTYEYADAEGGGERVDYFKTVNRYTVPTTLEIVRALWDQDITIMGFESIEWFCTDIPDEEPSLEVPEDSHSQKVYDVISDTHVNPYYVHTRSFTEFALPAGNARKKSTKKSRT